MRLTIALSLLVTANVSRADAPHAYVLHARLDTKQHLVTGRGRLVWTNESRRPQQELFLHLYLNAFRDEGTVFMREAGGKLRGVRFRGRGGIDIEALTLDGRDLLASAEHERTVGDRTQLRVPLPAAVAPGEHIELEVRWTARLPPVFARSGYHGDFHMVAQWFPKLARLEPDGRWATFPYHGHGEFYADFADYDVTVETPTGWVVGATGTLAREQEQGGRTTRRFVAPRVHDAVFVAAPWLRERWCTHQRQDGSRVRVRLLYPPGYESALRVHETITLEGLAHYERYFGRYPYPQLTVVVPPRGAEGAAGMEYPTLLVTAGPWLHVPGAPILFHEEVTAHELAHQWFQGLVATNEVRWPMLDEGITEWATGDLLAHRHGRDRSGLALGPLRVDGFELRRGFALQGLPTPPPGRSAHAFKGHAYGRSVYGRTSVVLETVARTWGRHRFRRALGTYARRGRFRHPTPEDLFAAFDAEYGPWMSRRVLRPALMDGTLASLRIGRPRVAAGRTRVQAERLDGLPIPSVVELRGPTGRRRIPWPGDVRILQVDEEGQWDTAQIDPDRHNLTDPDRRDDARSLHPRPPPFARLLALAQALLGALGP